MNLVEVLNGIWNQILEITSLFVMPDWGGLIGLLPVLIVLGLVGAVPDVPRAGHVHLPGPQAARERPLRGGPQACRDRAGGEPIFPVGLPYCRRDSLVYPSGTLRCEQCNDKLAVICPMCGLGRSALVDTCTNCGLVLKVKNRSVVVPVSSGPKPGGAAAA